MPKEKVNLNVGHRERMRQRYIKSGLDGFQPHEVLELLLFYSMPRCDTNKIAHELINRFHTLAGVMNADIKELRSVKGVGEQTALFLNLLPEVFKAYQISKNTEKLKFENKKSLRAYLMNIYTGTVEEQAYIICFGADGGVICIEPIGNGTSTKADFDIRSVVEAALRNRSDRVALVHNHPDGNSMPSREDVFATNCIIKALKPLDIQLFDHYIVGRSVTSMKECGYITD